MTPPARLAAAIELVDQILVAAREAGPAADAVAAAFFKTRRYAGSSDRRAIRELAWRAVRRAGDRPASGRSALIGLVGEEPALAALFDGSPYGPGPIEADEAVAPASVVPIWLQKRLDPLVGEEEQAALLARAPLDLRVNRLKGERQQALDEFPEAQATQLSPLGLRLPAGTKVEASLAWCEGLVEVQDEGSQLIALACEAAPGLTIVDLCAGAGGKTLALGAEMNGEGRLIACDTDRGRLSHMRTRLGRAGQAAVEVRLLDPGREREALFDLAGAAEIVLIDAPCSGSGTWRRNPETRWRLTPQRLAALVALQHRLLDLGAELVRPGGRLVYAVCSLLAEEGRGQAQALSERSSLVPASAGIEAGRTAGSGRLLTPGHDGTDGFYLARWQRPC